MSIKIIRMILANSAKFAQSCYNGKAKRRRTELWKIKNCLCMQRIFVET